MAIQPYTPELPATPLNFTLTPGMAPAAPLMRLLARFDRPKVEAFAEVSIALLDLMDGDCDIEPNGDELDGNIAEDEAGAGVFARGKFGAGCMLSDADTSVDDSGCDEPFQDLEEDQGVAVCHTGIDQSRSISPTNPAVL